MLNVVRIIPKVLLDIVLVSQYISRGSLDMIGDSHDMIPITGSQDILICLQNMLGYSQDMVTCLQDIVSVP
jgi:hypothetical protein